MKKFRLIFVFVALFFVTMNVNFANDDQSRDDSQSEEKTCDYVGKFVGKLSCSDDSKKPCPTLKCDDNPTTKKGDNKCEKECDEKGQKKGDEKGKKKGHEKKQESE